MFGVKTLLFGLTIGAGGMFAADRYHLVNTPDGYVVIPRVQSPALLDSYANVRGWGTEQWSRNIPLSQAIVAGGRGDLISEGIRSDLLRQASEGLGLTQGSNGQELEARTLQHSPNAGSAGAPEIIFGQSVSETRPSPPATSGGSLLDRLQQQLQSNPLNSKATSNKAGVPSASQGGVTGAGWSDFQERPLTRDIVPNSTYGSSIPASVPRQPGSSIPTSFNLNGQPVPTTTSVGTSSLPQFPSSESLSGNGFSSLSNVVTNAAAQVTSSTEFTGVDTTSSTPTGVIDNGIQNLKTLATEPLRQIVTENIQNLPQSIAPTTGSRSYYSASQSGQDFPLGVNAERLQSQIPVTVRDGLQSLLPRTRSLPVDNDLPQVAPF